MRRQALPRRVPARRPRGARSATAAASRRSGTRAIRSAGSSASSPPGAPRSALGQREQTARRRSSRRRSAGRRRASTSPTRPGPAPHPAREAAAADRHAPRSTSSTRPDFIDVVAQLHATGYARETIRKTLGAGAMVLDHAGLEPNPARDRSIKLPREEPRGDQPAERRPRRGRLPADPGQAPAGAALARLVRGARVERRPDAGRRLRRAPPAGPAALGDDEDAQGALGGAAPRARRARSGRRSRRARTATRTRACSPRAAPTRSAPSIAKACKAAGIPLWSAARPAPPPDLAAAPARLPWARIAEFVGQRDLTVTANTYTHVLVDETELDYAALLA